MASTAPSLSAALPSEPAPADLRKGWLLFCLFALYVIWGSTYLAIRWALEGGFPPLLMGGARFTLAGVLLYAVLRLRGEPTPSWRQWRASAFTGLLLLGLGNGGVVFAEQWVPSGVTALVVGSMPVWTALFGGLMSGQWPGRAERWGLVLGFLGIVLLTKGGELGEHWGALVALLVATVSWAFGSIWGKRSTSMPKGLMATATQMLCAGVVLLGVSYSVGERMTAMPDLRAMSSFLYLVAFGSLIAFSAYGYLLRHARPVVATSYAYVNPAVALLLGMGLGGETPGPYAFVAMTAILVAVMLITRKAPAKPVPRPAWRWVAAPPHELSRPRSQAVHATLGNTLMDLLQPSAACRVDVPPDDAALPLEVLRDARLDQLCLWSLRAFSAGDTIVSFRAAATYEHPARLTLQASEHEHIELAPSALTFTNHSCDANAYFDVERWELIALRPIASGDAITSFYPATEWTMASPFDCACGSPRCLGRIVGAAQLPEQALQDRRLAPHIMRLLREARRGR